MGNPVYLLRDRFGHARHNVAGTLDSTGAQVGTNPIGGRAG